MVQVAYLHFAQKIAGGIIEFENEASMQLLFAEILRDASHLFAYSWDDRITITREHPFHKQATSKSPSNAKADLYISITKKTKRCTAAIELKYLKNIKGATVTDNRFSVLQDIENLENYKVNAGYMLVYSDNINYANPQSRSYVKIGEGCTVSGKVKSAKKMVFLQNKYTFHWNTFVTQKNTHCFLLQRVPPITKP